MGAISLSSKEINKQMGVTNELIRSKPYNEINFDQKDIMNDQNSYPLPIFLHSSFRTSSTWFYEKFRRIPSVMAYYEVFHEGLEEISTSSIIDANYSSWESHHPPQAPYFLEYLPLLKASGGVSGFDASMSFSRFIPKNGMQGELSIEEKTYLNLLIAQAYRGGKTPLLSCTRSIGRMAAIKRHLPFKNIFLYRNLFHQWASYSGQFMRGNKYFINTIKEIILKCGNDNFLSSINLVFNLDEFAPTDEKCFYLFILTHLYIYAQMLESSDIAIDQTAICDDVDMRIAAEEDLYKLTSFHIDLSDVQNKFDSSILIVKDKIQFTDTIEQFVKIIASSCPSERSANFINRLANEALIEWDRYDFLTRNSINWYNSETNRLKRENEQWALDNAAAVSHGVTVANERDHIAAELAQMAGARDTAEATIVTLQEERNHIAAELAQVAGARDTAEATIVTLQEERNHIAAELAQITNDKALSRWLRLWKHSN